MNQVGSMLQVELQCMSNLIEEDYAKMFVFIFFIFILNARICPRIRILDFEYARSKSKFFF